jgi:hypothetical protein
VIIDQKGRLFGKVNIIDFLIALVIILAIGGMGYKVVSKYVKVPRIPIVVEKPDNTKIKYFKIKVQNVAPEIADSVRLRERLCNNDVSIDAWIVKIQKMPTHNFRDDSGLFVKDNPYKRDLIITVKAKVIVDPKVPYTKIGVQTANLNSDIAIKTEHIYLKGKVVGITDK